MLSVPARLDWRMVFAAENAAAWRRRVACLMLEAEARRPKADYNTGSITEDEAFALLALASMVRARIVIEVGTFIGTSTTSLAAAATVAAVYTCDISNDCLPSAGVITSFPKCTSTSMLIGIAGLGVTADLCFFDGVLSDEDVALLAKVTHPRTVYAFHDYNHGPKVRTKGGKTYLERMPRKGIGNVNLLAPRLPNHELVEPFEGSTLALLVPEAA